MTVYASMRDTGKADELRRAAQAENLSLHTLALDVRDQASVTAAVETIEKRHGAVDILVNNAGVFRTGPVETVPMELAQEMMDTNYWGLLRTVRAVLPAMRDRGSGVVVNVGSMVGRFPGTPYGGLYAATKHAMSVLTESLAFETAPLGIRVVCVEPGYTRTEIITKHWQEEIDPHSPYATDQEWNERFLRVVCQDDLLTSPADVADVVVRAAFDPLTPVHVLADESSEYNVAIARKCETFEEWRQAALAVMESAAGPRPIPRQPAT
ncbi:short-chain dehydrogenase [Streptomyces hygroscopicus subsp. jinggangensis 5008]|nr:short-chain dehydrogenase [Streptomyces hygroscopicus subsp. jinggangensis 5008]AGF59803.1 short-chain dehydrogenase [Streptomyces hygroscopicus subsp. jinggangensis TL01]